MAVMDNKWKVFTISASPVRTVTANDRYDRIRDFVQEAGFPSEEAMTALRSSALGPDRHVSCKMTDPTGDISPRTRARDPRRRVWCRIQK
jgi:hypothetical protein